MSAYYDLFEKPDVRQTGEQQSLYARFVPKGTIDRKEFIERVHLFTGLSRSLLEGAMAGFMDELRDCLANGWTVELGELGYFTPSLSCTRQATDKKELRAASIALRGLNFRLGREFYKDLKGKMQLERCPQSASAPASSADEALGVEQRWKLLDEYLQQYPCIQPRPVCTAGRTQLQAGCCRFEQVYRRGDADEAWDGAECGVCKEKVSKIWLFAIQKRTFTLIIDCFYGQDDSRAAASLHEQHPQQEHETGDGGTPLSFFPWFPFPCQCEAVAWHARHCTPQVSYGDIRERMFLAWARGMQIFCTSQK